MFALGRVDGPPATCKTVRDFCAANPERIDIVRFVPFDDRTLRAYDHAIFETEQV